MWSSVNAEAFKGYIELLQYNGFVKNTHLAMMDSHQVNCCVLNVLVPVGNACSSQSHQT